MNQNFITWNVSNMITVPLMVVVAFAVMGLCAQFYSSFLKSNS